MRIGVGILFLMVCLFGMVSGAGVCEAPDGYDCWYVATDGNDSNNGSFEFPFRNVQYALDMMSGGDVVYLRGGAYQEGSINILQSKDGTCSDIDCTTGSWSIIKSYPGEWAVIDGQNNTDVSEAGMCLGHLGYSDPNSEIHYWYFEKFEIKNCADENKTQANGLFLPGGPFKLRYLSIHDCSKGNEGGGNNPSGVRLLRSQDTMIEYCYFKDNGCSGGSSQSNCAHVSLFTDYKYCYNLVDLSHAEIRNEIRYNYFEGGYAGFKHKASQALTNKSNPDLENKILGDKIHHNIFINQTTAIMARQDYCQVYNNICDGGALLSHEKGSTSSQMFYQTVYNNLIIDAVLEMGSAYGPSVSCGITYPFSDDPPFYPIWTAVNNIVSSFENSWDRTSISCAKTGMKYQDFGTGNSINVDDLIIDRNLIYKPEWSLGQQQTINKHIIVGRHGGPYTGDSGGTYPYEGFTVSQFNSQYGAINYLNDLDGLFLSGTLADQYKTNSSFNLGSSINISNGGIGGVHPYLDGVTLPSYVGAVNPDDDAWVDGVLGLADVDYLMSAEDDPDWVEGAVSISCVDNDSDGYCDDLDCDDFNGSVFSLISCSYNGSSCGNFSVCGLSCLVAPVENCSNGVDDDCDGVVDCGCICDGDLDPCDGVVSLEEVYAYIERWLAEAEIGVFDVLDVIRVWNG